MEDGRAGLRKLDGCGKWLEVVIPVVVVVNVHCTSSCVDSVIIPYRLLVDHDWIPGFCLPFISAHFLKLSSPAFS